MVAGAGIKTQPYFFGGCGGFGNALAVPGPIDLMSGS
jgi:hypothetical protein